MNRDRRGTSVLLWAALLVGLLAQSARAGDWVWERMLDYEDGEDTAVAVATDATGNSYVLATCENDDGDCEAVVFKLTANGGNVGAPWHYGAGVDTSVIAVGMALDAPNGVLYVLGTYRDTLHDCDFGFVTLGYNLSGSLLFARSWNGAASVHPVDLALHNYDNGQGVVIVGTSGPDSPHLDYRLFRISGDTILLIGGLTRVRCAGMAIDAPGVYDCRWDCTDDIGRKLPAGVYFFSLSSAGKELKQKVVLQR